MIFPIENLTGFQDNIFEENAIPPSVLSELGKLNSNNGIIEKYIYELISSKFKNLENIICLCKDKDKFDLRKLLETARSNNGDAARYAR